MNILEIGIILHGWKLLTVAVRAKEYNHIHLSASKITTLIDLNDFL